MKFPDIKVALTLIIGTSVALAGCLKDKDYDNGLIQSVANGKTKVVSLATDVLGQDNFVTLAYDNSNNDTVVNFLPVELSNQNSPAPQDIHVTIALVDTLVDSYNNANGTSFTVPDPSLIQVVNTVVTIPKGSYQGFLQVKFKASTIIGQNLAMGFRIASIQEAGYTISGNLNNAVINPLIKNIYDGTYLANGVLIHPTLGGSFSKKSVILYTSGALSVDMAGGQPGVGGILGAYPRLTVDPATNKVTVTSTDPTITYGVPSDTTFVNRYDPAKKTFYINYGYTTSAPREAWDTLVYQGPR